MNSNEINGLTFKSDRLLGSAMQRRLDRGPIERWKRRSAGALERNSIPAMVVEQEDTMLRLALIVIIFTALIAGVAANAQSDGGYVAPELSRPTPGHLLNQDYLTSTGETVPRPGVPQSSGTTPLDRAIREQNDRIDNSICNGC